MRHLERSSQNDQASIERLHLARELGYTYGCSAKLSGLLNPRSPWLTEHTREGDLILEPESLYRGILYGAALSLLALTNGGSVGELLQISVDRDVVDAGERHQLLLPDGAKSERQPFRITEEASQLLQEIERGLVQTYGEVPLIHPTSQSRYDRLHAERYLFQWQRHLLDRSDVQTLVRFVLHQLPLPGVEGSPLHVTLDMLRDGRTPPEEAATTKERSLVLSDAFGFTQDVVEGLSSASRDTYCRDFFAYYQFAGSKETALQVQTLQRWMDHLVEANYKIGTVNRMADEVRSILHTAAAQGLIDQEVAAAVQSIKPIHREKTVESRG